jgi:hypothetical protein
MFNCKTVGECMKKIVLSLLLALVVLGLIVDNASANFVEINAKFGLDFSSKNKVYEKLYENMSVYTGKGQSVSLECLIPILNFFKFGLGAEYLLPRKLDKDYPGNFSACPVYVMFQINPFFGNLFIKGNFGKNVYLNIDEKNVSGKYYYGLGIGYEFIFIVVEFTCSVYEAFAELGSSYSSQRQQSGIFYVKNSLNVGYKFKI